MSEPRWRSIFDAARHNDEQAVKYFIEQKGVSPKETNTKKQTVAHIAALNRNLPMLEYVLSVDASVLTMLDQDKNNVFFNAIERGAFDLVQFLVECHGADIRQTNVYRFGCNAVHMAAKSGNLDILRYFAEEKGADVHALNNLFETPVFYGAEGRHLHVVQYLVEAWNVNVTCVDWCRCNILYASAKYGDLSVPKYLIEERGVVYDVNGRDIMGDTIVQRATKNEHLEFIKYFVDEKGADVNIADKFGMTPLYHAATLNNFEIVKFLLDRGADIQIGDIIYEKTPDKMSTADAVIKLLKKTMADKIEAQKQEAKRKKQLERQKVKDEKELEKQRLKAEREVQRQRVREEKELEKQRLRDEKRKLREEKEALKNTTMTMTKTRASKNATTKTPSDDESTSNFSNSTTSHQSSSSHQSMSLSEEESAEIDNLSSESVTISNDSTRELSAKRCRRNPPTPTEWSSLKSVGHRQFSYRELNRIPDTISGHHLSSMSTRLNSWQINSFLVIVYVCCRYLNLLSYRYRPH